MASISGINTRFFKDLFDWKRGRMNRTDYILLLCLIGVVEKLADMFPLTIVFDRASGFVCGFLAICIAIKRLHDCGLSGWWAVLYYGAYLGAFMSVYDAFKGDDFYPIMAILFFCIALLLVLWPGQKQENKYGKPYKDSAMFTCRTQ